MFRRCPVLREMFATGRTITGDGATVPFTTGIFPEHEEALFQIIRQAKPRLAVEIGMAQGGASLAIAAALELNGGEGRLISIDPYEGSHFQYAGRHALVRAGLAHRHELLEAPDWLALPQLARDGLSVDFAYIDGSHAFDYALLDTFYLDKLVPVGATLAFNDCGLEAIALVIKYLLSHRRYTEIDVGLAFAPGRPYGVMGALRQAHRHPLNAAAALGRVFDPRRFAEFRRPHQDRYFTKKDSWEPMTDIPMPF